ncbi:MAG: penicillin-binding protein 2 [Microbacteriaceae bacterium]
MSLNSDPQFQVRRRQLVVLFAVLVLCLPIIFRLVDFQVVRAADLNQEALQRRSIPVTIYGTRGNIYDADGKVMASSVMRYNITSSPRFATESFKRVSDEGVRETVSRDQAITELAEVTGVSAESIREALNKNPESDFAFLAQNVDVEVLRAVQNLAIPWVYSEQTPARTYPNGAVAGNLIGFMSKDGPGAGIELLLNETCLAPQNGTETYERGLDGVRIPGSTVVTEQVKNGADVQLTISSDLQWYAQEALAAGAQDARAEWATAIVIEVETGKIRAVAEYPTADSNNPGATHPDTWTSRSFTSPYEPGSTMKTLTLAAAMSEGAITSTTGVTVPWRVNFGNDIVIGDSFQHGDTKWTAAGVMAQSSNIGTIFLSQNIPSSVRYDYMVKTGFGSKTGVNFLGESRGIFNGPGKWDKHTELATNYGQGISVTAMQMAASYQVIGNDGKKIPLSLVEGCSWEDGTVTDTPDLSGTEQVFTPAAAQAAQDLLETTVNSSWLEPQLSIAGYRVGAKTGTAQVAENGRYGDKAVTSIIGMVPMDNPKYVVAVTLGYPVNKSTRAVAPIFRDIMTQVLKTYKIEPSTEPVVKLPTTW